MEGELTRKCLGFECREESDNRDWILGCWIFRCRNMWAACLRRLAELFRRHVLALGKLTRNIVLAVIHVRAESVLTIELRNYKADDFQRISLTLRTLSHQSTFCWDEPIDCFLSWLPSSSSTLLFCRNRLWKVRCFAKANEKYFLGDWKEIQSLVSLLICCLTSQALRVTISCLSRTFSDHWLSC